MTPLGWVFLVVSVAFVWGLVGRCFYKVLTGPRDIEEGPPPL